MMVESFTPSRISHHLFGGSTAMTEMLQNRTATANE
jgi:hypothetical protein